MPASAAPSPSPRLLRAVLLGGLLAGTWDIVFAFVYYGAHGATVPGVLQSVAGGLLGRDAAHQGGIATAALGGALHFLNAVIIAAIYVIASRHLTVLTRRPVPAGLLYGFAVFFVMNMVVLPLSAIHAHAWPPPWAPVPLVAHMIGVGLPIAFVARRYAITRTS